MGIDNDLNLSRIESKHEVELTLVESGFAELIGQVGEARQRTVEVSRRTVGEWRQAAGTVQDASSGTDVQGAGEYTKLLNENVDTFGDGLTAIGEQIAASDGSTVTEEVRGLVEGLKLAQNTTELMRAIDGLRNVLSSEWVMIPEVANLVEMANRMGGGDLGVGALRNNLERYWATLNHTDSEAGQSGGWRNFVGAFDGAKDMIDNANASLRTDVEQDRTAIESSRMGLMGVLDNYMSVRAGDFKE